MRWACTIAIWSLAASAQAEERTVGDMFREVEPISMVRAFVGHCVRNPGRLDKVGAIAEAMQYASTPEPFWTLLAPQEYDAPYHSWFVIEGEGSPFLLGISEAPIRNETYQICSVSNPFIEPEVALEALRTLVNIEALVSDETTAGQRIRSWSTNEILEGSFVSATDFSAMGSSGVTLSSAAPKQYQ